MQRHQIEQGKGFDDNNLDSGSTLFKGEYAPSTSNFASLSGNSLTSKTAGNKYNFVWTGDFMGNFRMKRQNKGLELFSTGTGSGDKQEFFEGYTNMFGLDTDNTATIESEVMYYVLDKIFTKLYQ